MPPQPLFPILRLFLLGAAVILAHAAFAQTATTVPVGAMTFTVAGGSVAVPSTTVISVPLHEEATLTSGVSTGVIASYTGSVITVTNAGWTPAELASTTTPFMLQLKSGAGEGRFLPITANTNATVTVSGVDLATEGVAAGDSFKIIPVDTLNTLFGSTTLQGGSSPASSDLVYLFEGGAWVGYYYNTTKNFWVKTPGPVTNKNDTVLKPDSGFMITRKGSSLLISFIGTVPSSKFKTTVVNAGSTLISTGFPVDTTIAGLSLDTKLAGWVKSSTAASADSVSIFSGGGWISYYYDPAKGFWRKTSGPATNQGSTPIPAGTLVLITKKGATAGTSSVTLPIPYTL